MGQSVLGIGDLKMVGFRTAAWTWMVVLAAPLLGTAQLRAEPVGDSCHACSAVCAQCTVVPDVRKESRVTYSCKASEFCLPHRSLWEMLLGNRGACQSCAACDDCRACPVETPPLCECRPRVKRMLLKKITTVECPTFRCEPVRLPQPCCSEMGAEPVTPHAP